MDPFTRPWVRALLSVPGLAFQGTVGLRNALYRRGWLRVEHVGVPVISVGNLTAGGTGKTPLVAYLAGRMREAGRRVAVVSRGYGGHRHDAPLPVSNGNGPLAGPEEAGDEAVLLSTLLPSLIVVVCRDRAAAARVARDRYGCDLVILDDGFQHRQLYRDLDLLLVDAGDGLGNGRMMPFGPLREPVKELRRAHALITTGTAGELDACTARTRELIRQQEIQVPVFACERRHDGFLQADTQEMIPTTALTGRKALVFSGIARPQAFESDLRVLGIEIVSVLRFRDHQPFSAARIERIRSAARASGADLLLTTEKDRVRLGSVRFPVPLYALRICLVPQNEDGLWKFISGRLFEPAQVSQAASE